MNVPEFLLELAAVLIFARIFAEVATRFGTPAVIGELTAGLVLGPSLLGWLEPSTELRLLAEIGIILFLFQIGLETDMRRLVRAGGQSLTVAAVGFATPFLFGYAASRHGFGLPPLVSLFIGGTLTATSIGITVRILQDVNRLGNYEGQVVLGAAVVDDILGVLLLALLYEVAVAGDASPLLLARVALFIGLFFLLAPVAGKLVSRVIQRAARLSQIPGLIPTTIVALVLSFASLAHLVGAPELLGGFAAGVALSRRFFLPFGLSISMRPAFGEAIDHQMRPIVQLFTPIFFVFVGLSLNLKAIDWSSWFIWAFSLGTAVLAILAKMAGGMVLLHKSWYMRTAVGIAMVPRGEVGLIFAQLGLATGIFVPDVYAGLVIVIAYTTLLAPFWIKLFYRLHGDALVSEDNSQ